MSSRGVAILSGGPDSAYAMCAAIKQHSHVEWSAIHFTYGQMAIPELNCARRQATHAGIPLYLYELPETLLTSDMVFGGENVAAEGLEPSFVPGRNAVFICIAAAKAYHKGKDVYVVGGWNALDYAGYPDCRPGFLSAIRQALSLGLDCHTHLLTPCIEMTKSAVLKGCMNFGVPLEHTWSCYRPRYTDESKCIPCGTCVSCELRAKGFSHLEIPDPLIGKGCDA